MEGYIYKIERWHHVCRNQLSFDICILHKMIKNIILYVTFCRINFDH